MFFRLSPAFSSVYLLMEYGVGTALGIFICLANNEERGRGNGQNTPSTYIIAVHDDMAFREIMTTGPLKCLVFC